MYPSSTGPQYIPGGSANTVMCVLVSILAFVLRIIHKRENRKLEEAESQASESVEEAGKPSEQTTRRPEAGFRYIL